MVDCEVENLDGTDGEMKKLNVFSGDSLQNELIFAWGQAGFDYAFSHLSNSDRKKLRLHGHFQLL